MADIKFKFEAQEVGAPVRSAGPRPELTGEER
jgi:hypothetical protein